MSVEVPGSIAAALRPDAVLEERVLGRERLASCPIFTVEKDMVATADGERQPRYLVRHGGGVGVVAIRDGLVCLVRQYRVALGRVTLEIPAGRLEPGERGVRAAARELSEETGLVAASLEPLVSVLGSPGFTSEHTEVFLATGLSEGASHPDEGEVLRVLWLPAHEVRDAILAGAIRDGKTVSGVLAAYAAGVLE